MKTNIKKIIRNLTREIINENDYFPTFDFEDHNDMSGEAYKTFVKDYYEETGGLPFDIKDGEIEKLQNALHMANLDLPTDYESVKFAEENIDKKLNGLKSKEEIDYIKNTLKKLGILFGSN